MGYGIAAAGGLEAAQQGLRQRLMDQMLLQKQKQDMAIQLREQALREQEAQQRGDLIRQGQADKVAANQAKESDVQDKAAVTAFTMNPAGATLAPKLALRGRMLGLPIDTVPGVSGPPTTQGIQSLDTPMAGASALRESTPESFKRGQTEADINKTQAEQLAARKQTDVEAQNKATNDLKSHIADITNQVRMGQMNNQEAMLAIRERLASVAEQNAAAKSNKGMTLSQNGKSAISAIEQAGPLTDQVMAMIKQEAPDIEANPGKYNGILAKGSSLLQTAKYKMGFHDETDPRQQLVSLLQPIQAGQYTRTSRSRQMLELALKHMADPTQTLLTQYQRAKELKSIMPEMREGIIRAEVPVDPSNPLAGSYFDPNKPQSGAPKQIRYDSSGKQLP